MRQIDRYKKKQIQNVVVGLNYSLKDFHFQENSVFYTISLKREMRISFLISKEDEFNYFCQYFSNTDNIPHIIKREWKYVIEEFQKWLNGVSSSFCFNLHEEEPLLEYFSDIITKISPRFSVIFNQAEKAEYYNLDEICGMGYRKSFEFLIKDYLIFLNLMSLEEANQNFKLQECINLYKEKSPILRQLATKIGYLGNDFCHYCRKYLDKDIKDLKEMIFLLCEWIETHESLNNRIRDIENEASRLTSDF